jgi:hypothetical protein
MKNEEKASPPTTHRDLTRQFAVTVEGRAKFPVQTGASNVVRLDDYRPKVTRPRPTGK